MKSFCETIRLITLIFSIGSCLFYGCAPVQPRTAPPARTKPGAVYPDHPDSHIIRDLLYRQVKEWKGTPYRFGGLSKEGIDCSGFVFITYLDRFGIRLPRSTYQQSQIGKYVFQRDLSAGDLVFFRIGYKTRHVGIYLENDLFAHASTSRGVMLSNLQEAYWSKRYWKAVRIKIDRL